MTGGVEESEEGEGVVGSSLIGDGPMSFSSGASDAVRSSIDCRTTAGGSSALAKSGSVMHWALCKGVEDNTCSLLACMASSLPRDVMGVDETE